MQALDEIIFASLSEQKTFHPAHERSEFAWFPGNEAASLLLQCRYVWDDIEALARVHRSNREVYARKLLVKYLIVEIRSLMEVFDRLRAYVMQAEVFGRAEESVWRGLTPAEYEVARELFKDYSVAKQSVEKIIIGIRNNIGAHRGNIDWQQVMLFWDQVSVDAVQPILDVVPRVFDHLKELDIYEWNRRLPDGSIEILGPRIFPEALGTIADQA